MKQAKEDAKDAVVKARKENATAAVLAEREADAARLKEQLQTEGEPLAEQYKQEIIPLKWRGGVAVLLAGGAGVLGYVLLAYVLRVPELRTIRTFFKRPAPPATGSAPPKKRKLKKP